MNEEKIKQIKKILLKHDYVTKLNKTGDGCIITYPHPKLLYEGRDIPRLIETIAIQRGEKPGFWVNSSHSETGQERFIQLPEYAMRLYIMCEVAACNLMIPIDSTLFVFLDENNEEHEEIEDIIDEPSYEIDRKNEKFLYGLVIEARNDGFPPEYSKVAETHGVGDGYESIRKFYIK